MPSDMEKSRPDIIENKEPLLSDEEKKTHQLKDFPLPEAKVRAATWPQVWITFFISLASFITGFSTGYGGMFLPDIRNDVNATIDQGSYIASLQSLGCIPGCLLSAVTTERYGRRFTIRLHMLPFIVGWAFIVFASDVYFLYIGRFLIGIAFGMMAGLKQVYLSEICDVRLRGLLASSTMTMANTGVLMSYVLALIMTWRGVAIVGLVMSIGTLVSYVFIPETPTWLIMKEKKEEAERVLRKIRGSRYDIEEEFEEITTKYNENKTEKAEAKGDWKQTLQLYFSPQTMKAFGILLVLFVTQRFSGSPVITAYIKDVFDDTSSEGSIDVHYVIITVGVIRVVFNLISNFLLKTVKKKLLYGVTGMGVALCLAVIGTYYYLEALNPDIGYSWIPGLSICFFYAFVTPGFFSASWVLVGELFPQRTRGSMSSIFTCVGFVLHYIVIKAYPDLNSALNSYGVFWLFSAVAFVGTICIVIVLPETKDKSLTQIENNLVKEKPIK